jgi:hypothetical protein
MVFDLILDAMNGFWQLGDAHTEGAITLLPTKVVQLSKSLGASRPMIQPLLIEWLWRREQSLAMTAANDIIFSRSPLI